MLPYLLTLFVYLFSFPVAFQISSSLWISLLVKLLLPASVLFYFRKNFSFKLKFDFLSVIFGVIIFFQWILLENFYPHLYIGDTYIYTIPSIFIKLLISVILAPVIEEFFTRFFLMRLIIDKYWERVEQGKYTFTSFLITVLFFGFSHERWLPGIIAGILLNILYYKKKDIGTCVLSHAAANLFLAIYIISTNSWNFW